MWVSFNKIGRVEIVHSQLLNYGFIWYESTYFRHLVEEHSNSTKNAWILLNLNTSLMILVKNKKKKQKLLNDTDDVYDA